MRSRAPQDHPGCPQTPNNLFDTHNFEWIMMGAPQDVISPVRRRRVRRGQMRKNDLSPHQ